MPDIWGIASIIVKFLLYIGVFGAAGSVLTCLVFAQLVASRDLSMRRSAFAFAALAMVATIFSYALRGAMLTGEASGMVDTEMLGLLWDTPVGAAFVTRLAGIFILILGLALAAAGRWIAVLGGVVTLWSFARVGHVPDHGAVWLSAVLLLHLLGIAFWIGILSPLKRLTNEEDNLEPAATLAHRFGQIATLVVPALIGAGVILLWRLTGGIDAGINVLLGTAYGWTLLLKIAIVAALLGLAAANKLRFVPAMQTGDVGAARRLSRSITLEWMAILIILLVTATLTSVLSLPM